MSDGATRGGNRRIDRVLDENYLADLASLSLEEVRALRTDADQEETDLSYLRRLMQGRVDLLTAEIERRRSGKEPEGDLVSRLAAILADADRLPARGQGRHRTVEPSRPGDNRRRAEALVADTALSDVAARTDEELQDALASLVDEERELSGRRRRVQEVLDAASAEIIRRYRDGEASVEALLRTAPDPSAG